MITFLSRGEGAALHLLKKKREAALVPISGGRIKVNEYFEMVKKMEFVPSF